MYCEVSSCTTNSTETKIKCPDQKSFKQNDIDSNTTDSLPMADNLSPSEPMECNSSLASLVSQKEAGKNSFDDIIMSETVSVLTKTHYGLIILKINYLNRFRLVLLEAVCRLKVRKHLTQPK